MKLQKVSITVQCPHCEAMNKIETQSPPSSLAAMPFVFNDPMTCGKCDEQFKCMVVPQGIKPSEFERGFKKRKGKSEYEVSV